MQGQSSVTNTGIHGAVDSFYTLGVTGWAFDKGNLGSPLIISAFVDAECVGTAVANLARPDVGQKRGAYNCGFEILFTRSVFPGEKIIVRASSDSEFRDFRLTLISELEGHVEQLSFASATGWAWLPNSPDVRLIVIAKIDDEIIGSSEASGNRVDLVASGRGDGCYGFSILFDSMVDPSRVEFIAVGDGVEYSLNVLNINSDESVVRRDLDVNLPQISGVENVSFGGGGSAFSVPEELVGAELVGVVGVADASFVLPSEMEVDVADFQSAVWPCQPLELRLEEGCSAALAVDHVYFCDNVAVVSGWFFGSASLVFVDPLTAAGCAPSFFKKFKREDVSRGYSKPSDLVHGFIAMWVAPPSDKIELSMDGLQQLKLSIGLADGVAFSKLQNSEFGSIVAAFLLRTGGGNVDGLAPLIHALPNLPANRSGARGFIETARGVPGIGGLVAGWAVGEPGVAFYLADDGGQSQDMSGAARWNRDDIIQAMGSEFGVHARDGGVLQAWNHKLAVGDLIKLIAVVDDGAYVVASARWSPAPVDPVAFAQWAFGYPTPREKFSQRLTQHDGRIINGLIERAAVHRPKVDPDIISFGSLCQSPRCSIIIPLYRRFDFMLNQMIEFARDSWLKDNCEIIYIIDDPNLVGPVKSIAEKLFATHGVPLRVVWAGQNRGFSGANNVGASLAAAPYLLLMNSDVIPTAPGWLEHMLAALIANERVGVLGARLHFPNGSIQHDGIAFRWTPDWGAYLNKHPSAGLCAALADVNQPVARPAVTAACMLVSVLDYASIGGLNETFLIGDFEDTDLCLRVRTLLGKSVACLQTVEGLIHLERQSFSAIGTPSFRDHVARFNAWKHQMAWGSTISSLPSYDNFRES